MKIIGFFALLLAVFGAGGCTARRGEAFAGPTPLSPAETHGQDVYMAWCNGCHPGGEGGLGPPLNSRPLPRWAIRTQVRLGAGAMPAFPRDQIDRQESKDLARYLKALRKH